MNSIMTIKDLSVYYDNVCALSKINLDIKEKDFLCIVGPNGGGKSTLLKTLLGIVKPTSGNVSIYGKSPRDAKGVIGYVPQFSKFDKDFPINVEDVILTSTLSNKNHFFHRFSKKDRDLCNEILKMLNLYKLRDRQIGELSGGQLQRVLIGRALALNPKVLILDEPTASLDSKSREDIYKILKDLNKEKTIILVTHDISNITRNGTTLACINKTVQYHGKAEINDIVARELYGSTLDDLAKRKI